jgi:alpha-beta hydrolase superfamily lysophospholipase
MSDADPVADAPTGRLVARAAPDGYPLKYRVWDGEDGRRTAATLILLNGVMSHSLWFHPLARPLLGAGLKLVGADRRGTGENDVARGDAPSGRALLDDAAAIFEAERIDGVPTYLAGWCWGAVLGLNLAERLVARGSATGSGLDGLIWMAPGLFPTAELKRRMAAQEDRARGSPVDRPCLESPIREDMFTSGPALAGFILRDPRRLAYFTPRFYDVMAKLAFGAQLRLPKQTLPTLLVLATDDLATDNAETERAFVQPKGGQVASRYVKGAHGLQFDAPAELARTIVEWIRGIARA